MTRVLHILDHSLPLHSGYCFRTRAILKAQQAAGHEVQGVTSARHGVFGAAAGVSTDVDRETVERLTFHRTAAAAGPSPLREWREVAALARRVEEVAADWRPDVLHAHSPALTGLAALRAAQATELPLLYEIRAFWEDAAVGNGTGQEGSARYRLTRALENHVIAGADALAVICDELKNDLVARGVARERITVSPNGVDLDLFGTAPDPDPALRRKLGLSERTVLGFVGSFYDYEGLDDLIAALVPLRRRVPDIHLLLVGGGPREDALRAMVDACGLNSRVTFTGRVPHDEVERYYALMDVMVYPRKSMRLTELVTPLKPLEAMAQGRIVAASDVGGHRELIEDGVTGTLFPNGDPDGMANALADLLEARGRWPEMIAAAQEYVRRHRNWSSNILRYDPVYQRLVGETRAPNAPAVAAA